MSTPARVRLTAETAPEAPSWWKEKLLPVIQSALADVGNALKKGLTRRENMVGDWDDVTFRTSAAVADTWPVPRKHRMAGKPEHVVCSRLKRKDGAAITAAWSMTWDLSGTNEIQLTFQGLSDATEYEARILYE